MGVRPGRLVLAVAVGAGLLAAAGCSPARPGVVSGGNGSGSTAPAASTAAGSSAGAQAGVGQPLTAKDLPGWSDVAMPAGTDASLFSPCGTPLGARSAQSAVRAAAVQAPTAVKVLSQVADYSSAQVAASTVTGTIAAHLGQCPVTTTKTADVVVKALPAPAGLSAAGAELVSTAKDTGFRDVSVYWAVASGASSVEVLVQAQFGASGDDPVPAFAQQVLAAAQAKAAGRAVPTLSVPTLPAMVTAAQRDAQIAAAAAGAKQSTQQGAQAVASDPGAPTPQATVTIPAEQAPAMVHTGVDGESGPSVITGSGNVPG